MLGLLNFSRFSAARLTAASRSRGVSSALQPCYNSSRLLGKLTASHRSLHAAFAMSPQPNGTLANGFTPESYGNFDLVRRLKLDFADIEVSKWQSRVTGLSVVHLDYDGECLQAACIRRTAGPH